MRCTVRRFSDTLSCNGSLRTYLSFCSWFEFECITVLSKSQGSKTGIPSMRKSVSTEIISTSVELWDTHVCFLHIQLIGTNMWLPNTHNVPPGVDFESSRSHAVSKSWNGHNLNFFGCISHMTILIVFTREMNARDQTYWTFVTSSGPCLWSHVQVCWLSMKYQDFRYVSNIDISGQFESIQFDNFSYGFQLFVFGLMVIKTWSWYLIKLLRSLVCQFTKTFLTFLDMTFHIVGPRRNT